MPRHLLHVLPPALTGALFLALWYGVHLWLSEDLRFLLPTPAAIIEALQENANALRRATFNTTLGALLGFALAVLVSCAFALLLSLSPLVRAGFYPYLMALQMM